MYTGIAKQELMAMLEEEELKDAILLVFANKQDQRGALNSRHVCPCCFTVTFCFGIVRLLYYVYNIINVDLVVVV